MKTFSGYVSFKEYRNANKAKVLGIERKYRAKNKEEIAKRKKKYYLDNKNEILKKKRKNYIEKTYGIPYTEYELRLSLQEYSCAICGKGSKEDEKRLAVDHNHENGDIRGLLCISCNLIIGHANDDIEILFSAIKYLEDYNLNFSHCPVRPVAVFSI